MVWGASSSVLPFGEVVTHQARITPEGVFQPILTPRLAAQLARKKGKEVEWDFVAKTRTLKQNARYWSLIVPAFAEWSGYEAYPELLEQRDLKNLKNSAHRTLKAMFIGPRTVIRTLPNGQTVTELQEPSTKDLTTAEMALLQDKAEKFLNENQMFLPA